MEIVFSEYSIFSWNIFLSYMKYYEILLIIITSYRKFEN